VRRPSGAFERFPREKLTCEKLQRAGALQNAVATAFVRKTPIDYHVALDANGKFAKPFGIRGIPHAMILDKEGKVVWEGHPMSLPESQLETVLR
jgi:hypothetical protein